MSERERKNEKERERERELVWGMRDGGGLCYGGFLSSFKHNLR